MTGQRRPLPLDVIRCDQRAQSRVALVPEVVADYADAYRGPDGALFPAVVVYRGSGTYWLADGFHRVAGARLAGCDEIDAVVYPGTLRDAILHGVGANAAHGLRRSNADKRRSVLQLLLDPEWSTWSNREIAAHARVSHTYVNTIRGELELERARAAEQLELPGNDSTSQVAAVAPRPEGGSNGTDDDGNGRAVRGAGGDDAGQAADRPVAGEGSGGVDAGGDRHRGSAGSGHPGAGSDGIDGERRADVPVSGGAVVETGWGEVATDTQLPNDERAEGDAYYTPDATAAACVSYLAQRVLPYVAELLHGRRAVEPSVGGGAWVRALRAHAPGWGVDRFDLDAGAVGLEHDRDESELAIVGDWLSPIRRQPGMERDRWNLLVGNRPYGGGTPLALQWFELCLQRANVVALLERETITGTARRLEWFEQHRPAYVVKVVPRPDWEGPGARDTSDFVDSVLIVWVRGWQGYTSWDWIDSRPFELARSAEVRS